jgi:hypothetical protein
MATALLGAAVGALALPSMAQADSTGLLDDTISLSLGTFLLSTDTHVTLNGHSGQTGSDVDLGRDLGVGDSNRFRVDATWRFAKRHKLRAMYFDTSQRAEKTIDRTLVIGDTTYDVGASLQSTNSTKIIELAYEYAFWQGDNYEVTGTFGVHTVKFNFGVTGEGTVNGTTKQASTETSSATAPLPVLGMRGLWEFSPQWYLDAQGQFFAIKIDNVDGHITDLRAGVTRMFGKHFGVGAGWNQFTTKVNLDKDTFEGSLRWRYSGAMIYITGSY